jgi:hypothetical protein
MRHRVSSLEVNLEPAECNYLACCAPAPPNGLEYASLYAAFLGQLPKSARSELRNPQSEMRILLRRSRAVPV